MLCEYQKCKRDARLVCKNCNKSTLYCNSHSKIHLNSNQTHSLELIKPSEIPRMIQAWKKSEINKNKLQIIDEAQRIINQVLDITRFMIIELENLNISIQKITDFKYIHIDHRKVSEIIHMVTLLSEDENYLSEEKRELKEVEIKDIEINKLTQTIIDLENNLKTLNDEKTRIVTQNEAEINRLTIYSEKRNKLLVNTESQLQKAEKDLKELNLVHSKKMEFLIQENENFKAMLNKNEASRIKFSEENNLKNQDNIVKILQETDNNLSKSLIMKKNLKIDSQEENPNIKDLSQNLIKSEVFNDSKEKSILPARKSSLQDNKIIEKITDSQQDRNDLHDRPLKYEEVKITKLLPEVMNIKIEDGTNDTPPKKIAYSKESVKRESVIRTQKLPETTKARPVKSNKIFDSGNPLSMTSTLTKVPFSSGSLNKKGFKTNFNTLSKATSANQVIRTPSGCLTSKTLKNDLNKNKNKVSTFNCKSYREMSKTPISQAKDHDDAYYYLSDKKYF